VDRDAIVRAQRRRQAGDALAFERERMAALEEQIDDLIVELEGARVDGEAFARMEPEEAELASSLLRPGDAEAPDEDEWLIFGDEAPEAEGESDPRAEAEDEIARLREEIAESRRRQAALERYLEALDESGVRQEQA
jgi:hypothetical protein